jgi:N-acylneuraminate cytidylyltransferase
MNICVIPARGGSKRIPRKNIKIFNGKPIIAYSIEAALQSDCFDKVIVSTDDDEIAKVAKKYGAKVPFIRPTEISNDFSGILPVIKHTVQWLEGNDEAPINVCCILPTAPFVQKKTIVEGYQQFIEEKTDYCFSVASFASPIQRAIKLTKENRINMFHPENFKIRSQDLEASYHDAGQFYWGLSVAFKEERPLFYKNSTPYVLPRYLVQDIDTLEDWTRAELMHKVLVESKLLK